ncbi:MAG TPA: O-antigen ligase family protein [Candidatus Sulfotelmatobacter sp.]|nr:O-antigen ligase family protein [Candidatus Sulfotelmatobacter sp.]
MAALCLYRRVFFPVVIVAFLLAGVDLPVGTVWTSARWLFLGIGAAGGCFIMLKERHHHFGLFQSIATFVVLTSLISAAVSSYPKVALLKVLSLFLLFLYAATGARVAVAGRESRFFSGLLLGCEIFVGLMALLYFVGIEAMGNPNSLGEVMGIAGAPILLWGALLGGPSAVNRRRWILYLISLYLTFHSHARAGEAAAFVSSFFLCFALRRYKLIIQGLVALSILIAAGAIYRPEALDSLMNATLYKQSGEEAGLFASRESPWNTAMDNIRAHPWFGMGLGTTAKGGDANAEQGTFASNTGVTIEHGSSYLAILSGVGMLGALPALILLLLIVGNVFRTWIWMRQSASPLHPSVPLATVMIAAMIHAGFEDWMFAPGNYMCIFFWALAFILADVAPKISLLSFSSQPRFVPLTVNPGVSSR